MQSPSNSFNARMGGSGSPSQPPKPNNGSPSPNKKPKLDDLDISAYGGDLSRLRSSEYLTDTVIDSIPPANVGCVQASY